MATAIKFYIEAYFSCGAGIGDPTDSFANGGDCDGGDAKLPSSNGGPACNDGTQCWARSRDEQETSDASAHWITTWSSVTSTILPGCRCVTDGVDPNRHPEWKSASRSSAEPRRTR